MNKVIILSILASFFLSCNDKTEPNLTKLKNQQITFFVQNLSDQDYPDNPDISFRALDYQNAYFKNGKLEQTADYFIFDFTFFSNTKDSILLKNINLKEFIPTIPEAIKNDDYLSYISCINQEWNRNQIRFDTSLFNTQNDKIVRVDIARNCLNSYLWEIIVYTNQNNKIVPFAHGWFNFPKELYRNLFEVKNNLSFDKFKAGMENWIDKPSKKIDFNQLRKIIDTISVSFLDKSDTMYPLTHARLKKYKEIIYPTTFKTMRQLQSDSTLFATFSQPGFYNKKDPRKTELGRINFLKKVALYQTISMINNDTLHEIKLDFEDQNNKRKTSLIIGGINIKSIPTLSSKEANKGWKSSMGIGNHTFYEKYQNHIVNKTNINPYYAILVDEKGNWLDSHKVGIDGPILHFSSQTNNSLNLWLLSFERHALVGHYQINIIN